MSGGQEVLEAHWWLRRCAMAERRLKGAFYREIAREFGVSVPRARQAIERHVRDLQKICRAEGTMPAEAPGAGSGLDERLRFWRAQARL